jgi:sulfate adenylyltransferase subunit 1
MQGPVQLLRLLTCGSVDDGKSTLIGRLLYDSLAVFADQIAAIEQASKRRGGGGGGVAAGEIDLSLFTDGLRWEREQGITIDVAHRYFSTASRRFILIDCPGHAQYTRNMVTGASHADLAVILVDARLGVQEQTHRHAYLAALLGIKELIVAVNKMDLVGWEEAAYLKVREAFEKLRHELHGANVTYVPVSALNGDNIVHRSTSAPWYTGPALLELLEAAPAHYLESDGPARFPVQYVIRPRAIVGHDDGERHDFRGFAGAVASGTFKVGDRVMAMSSGRTSTIESIRILDEKLDVCRPPQSVVMTLTDDIDIGRGDMLVKHDDAPVATREIGATVVWMGPSPMVAGKRYLLRQTTQFTPAMVSRIETKVNIHTFAHEAAGEKLEANDVANIHIRAASPLFVDLYDDCRATGSFVLIDEATGETCGAGLVRSVG